MNASDYIAFGSLLVSLVAILYAHFSNTKKYELKSQYRNEVLCWFYDTIEILMRLKLEAQHNVKDSTLTRELLAKLSAKIEIGRFYFPNSDRGDGFGAEKPQAYRGYRNLNLDFLVYSYQIFERDDSSDFLDHANILQR